MGFGIQGERMKQHSRIVRNSFLTLGSAALLSAGLTLAVAPSNALVIQWAGEMVTLDPQQAFDNNGSDVLTNVYDTLVTLERNSTKLVPMLAMDWKVSSDGKTITMALRKGVKFHSGNDFTCADAAYSLHRLLVTNNAASTAFYLSDAMLGFQYWDEKLIKSTSFSAIQNAASCDANGNLVIKLTRREPVFILRLTNTRGAILDSKTAIAAGEWDGTEATWKDWQNKEIANSSLNKADVGSGAYQIVSRESDQTIFKANTNYWGEKAKLENVIVKIGGTDAGRILAIKAGDADIISYANVNVVKQLQGANGVSVNRFSNTSASAVFFNQAIAKGSKFVGSGKLDGKGIPANFFADINVRRGFAAALDSKRIINEIFSGLADNLTMPVPTTLPGYDASIKTIPFNLERAAQEFRKASKRQLWKNGFSFEVVVSAGSDAAMSIMDLLKKNLKRINPKFKMKVKVMADSDLYAALVAGRVPLTISGNSAEIPDALSLLSFFYSSEGVFAVHTHFKDAQIDKLIGQLSQTDDLGKRAAIVRQVGRRGNELLPVVMIPEPITTQVSRSSIKGVKENFNSFRYSRLFWNSLSK
jgi:peptide/nickel transport system substrate-binding protein